jgi:hypothetical protein
MNPAVFSVLASAERKNSFRAIADARNCSDTVGQTISGTAVSAFYHVSPGPQALL